MFTYPSGGIFTAAATHLDGTLVSEDSPAEPGETVELFVAGLGAVSPPVQDGSATQASNLSQTTNSITVFVDSEPAQVTYSGLAPALPGIYQLNVVIPSGTNSGDVFIDVSGPDSYTSQAYIFVGNGPPSGDVSGALDSRAKRSPVPHTARSHDLMPAPSAPRN